MRLGYQRPLYLLPFDHRHSYVTGMFKFTPPLTAEEHSAVADSKQVIYEGFRFALGGDLPPARAGILVGEEFGAGILRDARANGYVTALSTEKSGVGARGSYREGVLAPVLSAALFGRFASRGDADYADRMLAMRREFGGHDESTTGGS